MSNNMIFEEIDPPRWTRRFKFRSYPEDQQVKMEAKRSAAVSESELNEASKGLHATKGTREHSDSLEFDPQVAEKLEALYEKFDGDIKTIFEELDENPRKALKHPPTSAVEFGKKYAQGFYTMAEAK